MADKGFAVVSVGDGVVIIVEVVADGVGEVIAAGVADGVTVT
jgi:hypothetical protein